MGNCSGATEAALFGTDSTLPPFAVPYEWSWVGVPTRDGVLQPGNQVCNGLRMLSAQGTSANDALDGLGHVQPRSAERGVQRHHSVCENPRHDRRTQVARQVVPDENQTERW